MRIHLIDVA